MDCWYEVPTTPGATDAVAMANGPAPPPLLVTVTEKFCETEALALSETVPLKLKTPAVVGVPLSTPAELSKVPGGSDPLEAQVYGVFPPVAKRVVEKPPLTLAEGSVEGVIMASGAMPD